MGGLVCVLQPVLASGGPRRASRKKSKIGGMWLYRRGWVKMVVARWRGPVARPAARWNHKSHPEKMKRGERTKKRTAAPAASRKTRPLRKKEAGPPQVGPGAAGARLPPGSPFGLLTADAFKGPERPKRVGPPLPARFSRMGTGFSLTRRRFEPLTEAKRCF